MRAMGRRCSLQPCTSAPPQVHMTTEHCIRLLDGPKLRFVRPSADLMLESVARTYGARAVSVVLSGSNTDAAVGCLALAQAGGLVLAQDEASCEFSEMPRAAMKVTAAGPGLGVDELALALRRWALSGVAPEQDPPASDAMPSPIKVMLVDDHQILLEGLRTLLEAEPDIQVVAAANNGSTAVARALELGPDMVVMDLRMPQIDGADATRQIIADRPGTKVIALSATSPIRFSCSHFSSPRVGSAAPSAPSRRSTGSTTRRSTSWCWRGAKSTWSSSR